MSKKELFYEEILQGTPNHIIASKCRKATKKEIAEAQRLHKKGKCPHTIIYDTQSHMYDIRTCATCGVNRGLI